MIRRATIILAAALATLSGCANKPLTLSCPDFRTRYITALEKSPTVKALESDVIADSGRAQPRSDLPNGRSLRAILRDILSPQDLRTASSVRTGAIENADAARSAATATADDPAILMLSGGGQWGAFGAGYLTALAKKRDGGLPRFKVITGVSTGALQAMFIGAAQAPGSNEIAVLERLSNNYNPASEKDIVYRRSEPSALLWGAIAGLEPLRVRIENAICDRATPDNPCPLLTALAQPDAPAVLVGFVEAARGQMFFADLNKIARDALKNGPNDAQAIATGKQCITAATLASVAMPFYYQQVQIVSKVSEDGPSSAATYYDGGVRQSVFFATVSKELRDAIRGNPYRLYIVRNGPTVALTDRKVDDPTGAVQSAQRGYALLVNQSEVSSIETARLTHPGATIRAITADGYSGGFHDPAAPADSDEWKEGCKKTDPKAMFLPQFMRCLQALGRNKAARNDDPRQDGWIKIP